MLGYLTLALCAVVADGVSLNHDVTGIQSVLPVPSASAAGPSVPE